MESYLNQADSGFGNHHPTHDTTSVSTSIACPPPGLPPLGATAPTSTYSEALASGQAPQTHMRGVSWPPSPQSRISFSGPPPDGPHPQNGGPNQAGVPGIHTKGAENSLSTADTSPRPLDPFHWGQERSHSRDDEEEITRVGVPSYLCRPQMRARHQGSRSHSQANWRGSRSGPSGSGA